MVFITSAQYLVAEFQVEFGKLPPAFLPLGQRRFYEYHARLFHAYNEPIILTLPESFTLHSFDVENLTKCNIEILFIPDNLRLGEAIVYALNMKLPLTQSVHILHGDIYLEKIESVENAIGVMRVDNNYEWEYLSNDYRTICDPEIANQQMYVTQCEEQFALSGYFHIQNPYVLIQSIVCSQYDYISGLKLYSQKHPFHVIEQSGWQDFGLLSSYLHAKQIITTQRVFNRLSFQEGFYLKTSLLHRKLQGEINWFLQFPKELSLHIPLFIQLDDQSYKIEYLYLNTLAELFVFGRLSVIVWKNILNSLQSFLFKLHKKTSTTQTNFNYTQKTFERLGDFCRARNFSFTTPFHFVDSNVALLTSGGGGVIYSHLILLYKICLQTLIHILHLHTIPVLYTVIFALVILCLIFEQIVLKHMIHEVLILAA
ncbi:MAG: capsular biosynthesis protein [Helicobacter trogontum]|uniref:capsular biosynthesis protein n=2 Tax=Helicobacter trogontum TaxID=50960 RepID=UPI00242C4734|nr:capsular biosynthesis protein [Helicobacter trogontum]MCI5786992.1 capsular biosynthesis protein [Helicobacter trogontum]